MIYLDIFIVACVVSLIHSTGFFDDMDEMVSKRWKFIHIPKIIMCQNCLTWWCCLIWVLFSGNLSLFSLLFCILMWYVSPLISRVLQLIIDGFGCILDKLSEIIY